ncbi:cbb3-type cytochrome c oxidase subunit I [Acidiferrimicrobium sp. IK]|uniref:cytochrome c oxidase subunit I n=1 Tax=Acidiferrimicrobium sp. IK TaxID=2871700 RepID=UPI0021CAF341|nr:cbb3-type cytochrome c oxidase subunit I [Acidiferrimicrobium sp. IK]MCU4183113.1 cbb3-type cytochrome c oxidase subunit I [Acidiferrimicrobium sp. IK]
MTTVVPQAVPAGDVRAPGLVGLLTTTDHKKIGLLTLATSLGLFAVMGAMALVMRSQLAQPNQHLIPLQVYNQLFTIHGSGMIYLVITPFALGAGVYLVPLHVGAPAIAAPRTTLLAFWLYAFGAVSLLSGFGVGGGAASDGWYAYTPLSDSTFTPGSGMSLWIVGVFLAACGMILMSATVLWTALRLRAPGMTLLRMPVFTWSMVVTTLMGVASFPSLLGAMVMMAIGRSDPSLFDANTWNIAYQNLFWFYGHPVVYIMFFPFVGAVAESLATFSGRRYAGYRPTVLALLAFAALSMSVWGHHMFVTGQAANDYYSLTSIALSVPAGVEYFGFLATIIGGRLRYTTSMLFALGFIPQFLVGGLTGVMLGTPVVDYHVQGSYFIVAHFHYTLFGGSVFGMFAGVYLWWPKVTGFMLSERLGKAHFVLMVIGTNMTFLPMFGLGFLGLPRRVATYPDQAWFGTLNLISSIGAGVIALAMAVFAFNVVHSRRHRVAAPDDPWAGQTLEWATSSPPPRWNYDVIPPITSHAPLLDLRDADDERVGA